MFIGSGNLVQKCVNIVRQRNGVIITCSINSLFDRKVPVEIFENNFWCVIISNYGAIGSGEGGAAAVLTESGGIGINGVMAGLMVSKKRNSEDLSKKSVLLAKSVRSSKSILSTS